MSDYHTRRAVRPSLRASQAGVASFLVTMVLMVVITLIVLGFAQISRRNQREALDNQLSTQAFYAAETGVNLVQKLMQGGTATSKSICGSQGQYTQLNNGTSQVANSCLTVDTAPTSLRYDNISTDSTVVPLKPDATGYGPGTLTIQWQNKNPTAGDTLSDCPTAAGDYGTFTQAVDWKSTCPYGVLRFDMVDTTAALPLSPTTLAQHTMTVFAPPTVSHAAIVQTASYETSLPADNDVKVECDNATCTATLTNVNFNDTNYLRLTSLYKDVTISSIEGTAAATDTPVKFVGAQIAVDSTGRAVDVLRRIQVRLDENNQLTPSYAIEGTKGVCKQSYTYGGSTFGDNCTPSY